MKLFKKSNQSIFVTLIAFFLTIWVDGSCTCFKTKELRIHMFPYLSSKQNPDDFNIPPDLNVKVKFKDKFLQEVWDKLSKGDVSAATMKNSNGELSINVMAKELGLPNEQRSDLFDLFDLLLGNGVDINGPPYAIFNYALTAAKSELEVIQKFKEKGCTTFFKTAAKIKGKITCNAVDEIMKKKSDKSVLLYILDNSGSELTDKFILNAACKEEYGMIHKAIIYGYDTVVVEKMLHVLNPIKKYPKVRLYTIFSFFDKAYKDDLWTYYPGMTQDDKECLIISMLRKLKDPKFKFGFPSKAALGTITPEEDKLCKMLYDFIGL